ncbi:MAG TPA: hypothetical protein PKM78_04890 [Anaerolineae bacterium]|nr:hypothetical protein [Anaerolineae bacterium]
MIAFFSSREAAETAMDALKDWDHANKEVKLGAIGLVFKEEGEIKTVAPRRTGRGVAVGAILGVFAAALGPVGLIGAALGGGAIGGALGSLFKQSVNLDEAALQEMAAQLDAGKFGVVVAVDEHEMTPTAAQLANAGGAVQQIVVPTDALAEAMEAVPDEYQSGFESRREDLDAAQTVAPGSITPLM